MTTDNPEESRFYGREDRIRYRAASRLEDVKKLASRIMHMHYCEHDIEGITSCFSEQFSWMGAGEQEYLSGRKACATTSRKFRESIPDCNIWDEEYDVVCPWKTCMLL